MIGDMIVNEYEQKLGLIRSWMTDRKVGALCLQRVSSFAWATYGAASYINVASTDGVASLLITQDQHYLFTNYIDAPRLEKEEKLLDQGWDFRVTPWHVTNDNIGDLTRGLSLAADGFFPGALDISSELARLRACVSSEEVARFRDLGGMCAQAMEASTSAIRPGMTEHSIAGFLAGDAEKRGMQAIVNLIATDERIYGFRHPLPTEKKFDRYAMLVLCGRRGGLVCSLTRFVHFGRLPDELRRKAGAVVPSMPRSSPPPAPVGPWAHLRAGSGGIRHSRFRRRMAAAPSGGACRLRAARVFGNTWFQRNRCIRAGSCLEPIHYWL
jgi:Xaa-Pro aminopeptidase